MGLGAAGRGGEILLLLFFLYFLSFGLYFWHVLLVAFGMFGLIRVLLFLIRLKVMPFAFCCFGVSHYLRSLDYRLLMTSLIRFLLNSSMFALKIYIFLILLGER